MSDHLLPAFTGAPDMNRVYHADLITVCLKCHRRLHTEMSNHASTAE